MPKLTFDEALEAINSERYITRDDVQARALARVVWVAEWHVPGCMSESRSYSTTKAGAPEDALDMCCHVRGARSDLIRYGRTDRVSPDAYVSMAITTMERCTLRDLI